MNRLPTAIFATAVLALSGAMPAGAEDMPTSPIDTVRFLFNKADAKQARDLSTGELGEAVARRGPLADPKLAFQNIKVVREDEKTAVISTDLPGGRAPSGYIFLAREDGRWKAEAIRVFPLPANLVRMRDGWAKASPEQRKEILAKSPAAAGADYDRLFAAVDLMMQPDRALIAHFNERRASFAALQRGVIEGGLTGETSAAALVEGKTPGWRNPPGEAQRQAMATQFVELLLAGGARASLGTEERDKPLCGVDCLMLSMFENGRASLGYLWIGPKGSVPEMSPVNFIVLEPLGEGWYLYKTV